MANINVLLSIRKNDIINSKDATEEMLKKYEYSQLLISIGQQKEALPYLQDAMSHVNNLKNEFIWENYYVSIGQLYASTLDFLGDFDKAELIYKELIDKNHEGFFLGDYALFLHRRRRDFENAQM
jgi:tetratricopeptide (TPR) repeat protein